MRSFPDDYNYFQALLSPYHFIISTPKNTPSGSKKSTTLSLAKGLVQDLVIIFPYGSVGLLYLQFYYSGSLVYPHRSGYFHGEKDTFHYSNLNLPFITSPYELVAKTWNDDDTFAHAVDIYIAISSIIKD